MMVPARTTRECFPVLDDPAAAPTSRVHPWDFRTFLALLMATIATFGALAAYRAALADDDVAAATRLFDEGQILELDKRQRYLDEVGVSAVFERQSAALREEARKLTSTPLMRLQSQEDLAVARITDRYERYYNWDLTGYTVEGEVERWAATDLGALGFNVSWDPSYDQAKVEPDIWAAQRDEIGALGVQLRTLTAAVVLFVLSLFCLTLADLTAPSQRKRWLIVGLVPAAIAIIFVLARLHDTATVVIAITGTVVAAVLTVRLLSMTASSAQETKNGEPDGGQKPRRFSQWWLAMTTPGAEGEDHDTTAAELEPTGYIGSRVITRVTHGAFSKTVVIAIAITALLSAFCGHIYSRTSDNMNESSSAAVADQATQFRENTRSRTVANFIVSEVMRLQENQARYDAAAQAMQLVDEGMLRVPSAAIEQEKRVRAAIYADDVKALEKDNQSPLRSLLFDTSDASSVVSDASFPSRLIEDRSSVGSDRAFAMWDADNALSLAYHRKMSVYLAGLTLFAIALYLYGQALGIAGFFATRILSLVATMFVVIGSTIMFWSILVPVDRGHVKAVATANVPAACRDEWRTYEAETSDVRYQSAEHYACGLHLSRLAESPAEHRAAAAEFAVATRLRPTFAIAQAEHAGETSQASTPQRDANYSTLPTTDREELARTVQEERNAARELARQGFEKPSLLSTLGYDLYVHGLLTGRRAELAEASRALDRSMAAYRRYDDVEGWALANQAIVLLARGRFTEAERLYRSAQLSGVTMNSGMALGALTDLEMLGSLCHRALDETRCATIARDLPVLKAEITQAVWPAAVPAGRSDMPSVRADALQVTPGGAAWKAHVVGGHASNEKLLAVWYRFDTTWNVWVAAPWLQRPPETLDANGRASAFDAVLPNDDFKGCVTDGLYRVEFYLRGVLAGSARVENSFKGYQANFDPRLNLALCSPPSWKRDDSASQDGVAAILYPPRHQSAVMLVRRDDPQPIDELAASRIAANELGSVLHAQPRPMRPDRFCAGMSLGWRRQWYLVRGHSALVQTKVANDGEIYEGFFVAPGPQPDAEQCASASSLVEFSS